MTDIATAAAAFVRKWEAVSLNEKATAQEHFVDLCRLLGQKTPNEADPNGTFYRFEKPLTKSGGGAGFADVWFKDRFAWEYKTKGKYPDLRAAYNQLVLYKGDLDNPPVLVACDIASYEVSIEFTGYRSRVERFTNADLQNAATRDLLRLVFSDPERLRPVERAETITEKAAAQLAEVAVLLEKRGFGAAQIAPFFMQTLFALFAEDIHLLPAELMSKSIRQAIFNPPEFVPIASALFQTMRTGGYFGLGNRIPRFNGWLFEADTVLPLNATELQFLAEVARLDWSSVEPAIFGTLFERSLDKQKRAQLGAHYTSRDDILLIVEPVLMQPLRREWAAVQEGTHALHDQWATVGGAARQRLRSVAEGMIFEFMERLAKLQVLDPACGSGNFLYVALHQLKDLEQEVWRYAGGLELSQPELGVTPLQLHGIEKNPFAAELAQVVIWIGYLQWLRKNGWLEGTPAEPILQTLHSIECRDAILDFDAQGNPVEPAWPAVDVIIGNPPFLGDKKMLRELGDNYTTHLRKLYEGRVPAGADLVTYWFEKSREELINNQAKRVGLLATQAIRQGISRRILERITETGNIFMAWNDRPWILDGAAIRVSMIGFDDGKEQYIALNGENVFSIASNLQGLINLTKAKRLVENIGIAFIGGMKKGAFDITEKVAFELIKTKNINGRNNADVIRPWINGLDVTNRPRNMWVIDFGTDTQEDIAKQYSAPYEYVKLNVKPARDKVRNTLEREKWWLHARPAPDLRIATAGLSKYIVTPRVAKHRIFVFTDARTIADGRLVAIARENDYFLGVLQGRIHEVWSLATSSRHGDGDDGGRPTYNVSTCFETYPFPWPPGSEPGEDEPLVAAIAEAARALVRLRDGWLNEAGLSDKEQKQRTLTNLYNKRPDWLSSAHQRLDEAVFAAYGWPGELSDDEILARLLALNLARAAQGGAVPAASDEDEEGEA
jgi:hypothetical protein